MNENAVAAAALSLGRHVERLDGRIRLSAQAQAAGDAPAWIGAFLDRAALQAAAALFAPDDPRYDEPGLRDMLAFAGPEALERDMRLSIASKFRRRTRLSPAGTASSLVEALAPVVNERAGSAGLRPRERLEHRAELWSEADQLLCRHLGWSRIVPLYTLGRLHPVTSQQDAASSLEDDLARVANAVMRLERLARDVCAAAARLTQEATSRSPLFDQAVRRILDQDHVVAQREERSLRRLYSVLTEQRALRELSGRMTARVWGL